MLLSLLIFIVLLHDTMAFYSSIRLFKGFDLFLHTMHFLGSKYIEMYTAQ